MTDTELSPEAAFRDAQYQGYPLASTISALLGRKVTLATRLSRISTDQRPCSLAEEHPDLLARVLEASIHRNNGTALAEILNDSIHRGRGMIEALVFLAPTGPRRNSLTLAQLCCSCNAFECLRILARFDLVQADRDWLLEIALSSASLQCFFYLLHTGHSDVAPEDWLIRIGLLASHRTHFRHLALRYSTHPAASFGPPPCTEDRPTENLLAGIMAASGAPQILTLLRELLGKGGDYHLNTAASCLDGRTLLQVLTRSSLFPSLAGDHGAELVEVCQLDQEPLHLFLHFDGEQQVRDLCTQWPALRGLLLAGDAWFPETGFMAGGLGLKWKSTSEELSLLWTKIGAAGRGGNREGLVRDLLTRLSPRDYIRFLKLGKQARSRRGKPHRVEVTWSLADIRLL